MVLSSFLASHLLALLQKRTVKWLSKILLGDSQEAVRLFLQLQYEPEDRILSACQHSFGKKTGAIKRLRGFVEKYIKYVPKRMPVFL